MSKSQFLSQPSGSLAGASADAGLLLAGGKTDEKHVHRLRPKQLGAAFHQTDHPRHQPVNQRNLTVTGCSTVLLRTFGGSRRRYFTKGIPKSLQIFRASRSRISVCRGTEDRLFCVGFNHHEWQPPSRTKTQPCSPRCFKNSVRFIRSAVLRCNRELPLESPLPG